MFDTFVDLKLWFLMCFSWGRCDINDVGPMNFFLCAVFSRPEEPLNNNDVIYTSAMLESRDIKNRLMIVASIGIELARRDNDDRRTRRPPPSP
jgi:hypothetical protein